LNFGFNRRSLGILANLIPSLSLTVLLTVFLATSVGAQTTPPPETAAVSSPASETIITEYSPPPDNAAKSAAYRGVLHLHYFGNTLYGFLVLLLVLWWRLGPKYRDWAERASKRRFVQVLIFAPLLLLTVSVLNLPTSLWDQSIELKFGRSVQRWGSWFSEWITGQIILLIVGTLVVWILYGVIRRSPQRWWFYFWLASIPIISILLFLRPLIIDPLFFKFKPLAGSHPDLALQVEQVVHHGGMDIPRERMFEMNASTKTTEMNAYVAGFGTSKRAVMWDTILTKATPQEALFVFGYEMGHYVLLHLPQLIGWISLLLLVLFYISYRLVGGILQRCYGIEVIHGIVPNANQVAAHYFEKSGEINLNDPAPSEWVKIWFYDHPTRPERVHFVATYDPWSQGKKGKYVP
jgi:Zn-dependent protease with chaperone function